MSKWERGSVYVETEAGSKEVFGWVSYPFGYWDVGGRVNLTHLPSGYAMAKNLPWQTARRVTRLLFRIATKDVWTRYHELSLEERVSISLAATKEMRDAGIDPGLRAVRGPKSTVLPKTEAESEE